MLEQAFEEWYFGETVQAQLADRANFYGAFRCGYELATAHKGWPKIVGVIMGPNVSDIYADIVYKKYIENTVLIAIIVPTVTATEIKTSTVPELEASVWISVWAAEVDKINKLRIDICDSILVIWSDDDALKDTIAYAQKTGKSIEFYENK